MATPKFRIAGAAAASYNDGLFGGHRGPDAVHSLLVLGSHTALQGRDACSGLRLQCSQLVGKSSGVGRPSRPSRLNSGASARKVHLTTTRSRPPPPP